MTEHNTTTLSGYLGGVLMCVHENLERWVLTTSTLPLTTASASKASFLRLESQYSEPTTIIGKIIVVYQP